MVCENYLYCTAMVENGAVSPKISNIFKETPNLEGDLNHITGSKVTVILLNGWILPIDGASAGLRLQPAQQACSQTKCSCTMID